MAVWPTSERWVRVRRVVRSFRILGLLLLLFLAGALLYLNTIGLPRFIQARISQALESQGIHLRFQRFRLSGYRQILVENVSFGTPQATNQPQVSLKRASLVLNRDALHHFNLKVDGLDVQDGTLRWPLTATNTPPIQVTGIRGSLRFMGDDRWDLSDFYAKAFGATFAVNATVTNAQAFQKKGTGAGTNAIPVPWQAKLQQFAQTMQQVKFAETPEFVASLTGDAKDPSSFKAEVHLQGKGAETPWGQAQDVDLTAALLPRGTNGSSALTLLLRISEVQTRWSKLARVVLSGRGDYSFDQGAPIETEWSLQSDSIAWKGGGATVVRGAAKTALTTLGDYNTTISFASSNLTFGSSTTTRPAFEMAFRHLAPTQDRLSGWFESWSSTRNLLSGANLGKSGEWKLNWESLRSPDFAGGQSTWTGSFQESASHPNIPAGRPWSNWGILQKFQILAHVAATDGRFGAWKGTNLDFEVDWTAPALNVKNLRGQFGTGQMRVDGSLDLESEVGKINTDVSLDWEWFRPLLPFPIQKEVASTAWESNPKLVFSSRWTLPSTINELGQALQHGRAQGTLETGPGLLRSLAVQSLQTTFSVTNGQWRIHELQLATPDGPLRATATFNEDTSAFGAEVNSQLSPAWISPLLNEDGKFVLRTFNWTEPPKISVAVTGVLGSSKELFAKGKLSATNFVFRDQHWDSLSTSFSYTNLFINLADFVLMREPPRELRAPFGGFDLREMVGYVTNAVSNIDPIPFVTVMGDQVLNAVAPYHFLEPPNVKINGRIPTTVVKKADLVFDIEGTKFNYWRFNMPDVKAQVIWKGNNLSVSNVTGTFYGGHAEWEGHFHFLDDDSADYGFTGTVTNADLRTLLADIIPSTNALGTNQMSGKLNGKLVLVSANTEDWKSWKGYGDARLREGQLWSTPIFGFFTPALNAISPGLGNNTATAATGAFTMDKSVIYTKNLEVRAPALRLKYQGSVDFDGNLDATAMAEPLRDAWVVGRAVSMAFWPISKALEYKVTGTLSSPQTKPLHIPKVMLFPFRPIQSLKELFPGDSKEEDKKADDPTKPPHRPAGEK